MVCHLEDSYMVSYKAFYHSVNDIISLYINITDPVSCVMRIKFNTDIALQADLCIAACTFQSFHHVLYQVSEVAPYLVPSGAV